jgi:hypothetical protein
VRERAGEKGEAHRLAHRGEPPAPARPG